MGTNLTDMVYDFSVIAIGSSAGGIAPLIEIVSQLPADIQAAVVLVPHLHAKHKSELDLVLSKYTAIPVVKVEHQLPLKPQTIYLLPEDKMMILKDGLLLLRDRRSDEIINNAIDIFFSSVALDAKDKAIGVILSGGGHDGLSGANHIHERNGLVIVQNPKNAEFPYMPSSVIEKDDPDYILTPSAIADIIQEHVDERTALLLNQNSTHKNKF